MKLLIKRFDRRIMTFQAFPGLALVVAWELSVGLNPRLGFFFGRPSKIAFYLAAKTADGSLPVDAAVTFLEASAGFLLGNTVGTLGGLGLWYSRTAFLVARPYIVAMGSAPLVALAPLLVIWFGTGVLAKAMVAALSTVFVALLQAHTGAGEVNADYLKLMRSFGATKHQIFRKVVAPSAVVWVISAFRLNVGFALLGAFIGEFISSSHGLGHLILVAGGLFDISLVFCGLLVFVSIALGSNVLVSRIEGRLTRALVRVL